jgi:hypothetical protein
MARCVRCVGGCRFPQIGPASENEGYDGVPRLRRSASTLPGSALPGLPGPRQRHGVHVAFYEAAGRVNS